MPPTPTPEAGALDALAPRGQVTDEALIERIAAGDRGAVTELYARYERPLSRYLWQLTSDRSLAEAVLQDTVVAAWQDAASFTAWCDEDRPPVRTWLLALAHRQAHLALRRRGRLTGSEVPRDAGEQPLAARDATEVERAIARLPLIHREVLALAFVTGLRHSEIAAVLGVSPGSVPSRLGDARRDLRRLLHDDGTARGDAVLDPSVEGAHQ